MSDYHLYDSWIEQCVNNGVKKSEFKYYTDYSIGFLTRGCFRKCSFCVNKKYDRCIQHSALSEFMEPTRRKLCFLDDNFFACIEYKEIIDEVKNTNKPFQFKQGLDERLITTEKTLDMSSWKYDGDFIFAFDNIEDKYMIIDKLRILNKFLPAKRKKFYVLCGFDRKNQYGNDFFEQDIEELFERISILKRYKSLPYIMRHENYIKSPYS